MARTSTFINNNISNINSNKNSNIILPANNSNIYGIGLGLRIVKILVQILGKDFKIISKERKGTIVSFSLYVDMSLKANIKKDK